MISAKDLIKQFHSPEKGFDLDLMNIETKIMMAAKEGLRECRYNIETAKYSTAMNALKELEYKVKIEKDFNKSITILVINW